jgi:polyhydroxybutyrate depolymerase
MVGTKHGVGLFALLIACGEPGDEGGANEEGGTDDDGGSTQGDDGTDDSADSTSSTSAETTADPDTTGAPVECGVVDGLSPGDHERTLDHGGMTRSYILHVPEGHDPETAAPLLLNMHGYLSSPQMQSQWSQMNETSDPRGWVVAYPAGTANSWNGGSCCGDAASGGIDDVAFLRAVVADISTLVCVDPRRVHATGMSNGGYMSHRLACEASDVFASVAPVAGALGITDCNPSRPMSVLAFHGVQDTLVAYEDDVTSIETWAALGGCNSEPAQEDFRGGNFRNYEGCDAGAAVGLYTLDPMGHCWPGGNASQCFEFLGPHSDATDANTTMLDFFDAHRLP